MWVCIFVSKILGSIRKINLSYKYPYFKTVGLLVKHIDYWHQFVWPFWIFSTSRKELRTTGSVSEMAWVHTFLQKCLQVFLCTLDLLPN